MPVILVICTANICRSPVAEALLRRQLNQQQPAEHWIVRSAGTWAQWPRGASRNSVDIMADRGIDIGEHRARLVSRHMLAEADLVLAMASHHVEALRAEFPEFGDKLYRLSEMAGKHYNVADPYGGPRSEYEMMVDDVSFLIDAGLPRIIALAQASVARRKQT